MPAAAIIWGPWAVGMAAADARVAARFERAGLALLTPPLGLRLLAAALGALRPQSVAAAPVAWERLLPRSAPPPPAFAALLRAGRRGGRQEGGRPALAAADERAARLEPEQDALRACAQPADASVAAAKPLQVVEEAVAALLGTRVAADQVQGRPSHAGRAHALASEGWSLS